MKYFVFISFLIFSLSILADTQADLLNCDELLPGLSDLPIVGPKVTSDEDTREQFTKYLKKWGCEIKKGARKLNEDVKNGVKKLSDKAKDLGSKFESKFQQFKERLSDDTSFEQLDEKSKKFILENVEMINPDVFKADQECGHGHILDSLGNCRKLRK